MAIADSPNPFKGVWHRHFIQFDQDPPETTQSVLWIQAQSTFADVRSVPFTEPLTADRYRTLTWRQRFDVDLIGFAGHFTWQPVDETTGTSAWHHSLAITPRSRPDTSRYQWIGSDDFVERGTCEDDQGRSHNFLEHWHRVYDGPVTTWSLNPDLGQGLALVAGPWAVLIYHQRQPHLDPWQDDFKSFAATAWHQVAENWQLQFGSLDPRVTVSAWTPVDLKADSPSGDWQCHHQ